MKQIGQSIPRVFLEIIENDRERKELLGAIERCDDDLTLENWRRLKQLTRERDALRLGAINLLGKGAPHEASPRRVNARR